MKLPNDLIKATDYDKSKDRIIKEFECVNGKIVQHYALGGEHELTTQEIIDCLNALSTIDCDLQTAYAYIKGQNEQIADLEAKLAEKEKEIKLNETFYEHELKVARDFAKQRDKYSLELVEKVRKNNQDKILFCIEQLEKVKEFNRKVWGTEYAEKEVNEYIDNQIKQLKEMK